MTGLDIRPVLYVIGALVSVVALAMLLPMAVDIYYGHSDWQVFAAASAITLFFGVLLILTNRVEQLTLSLRQTFVLTTFSWVVIGAFSAAPFMVSSLKLSPADAYFEAMSGLTTTGATVISGLDDLAPGLLMWRSALQFLGGVGIIAMAIAVLPFLRVGGMQLFRSESSDRSDKVVPRASDLAIEVLWFYCLAAAVCAVALSWAGMSGFDAINHAMTAIATGGFSTRDASVGAWDNAAVHWILVLFMVIGGMPLVRFVSVMRGDFVPLWRDTQIRWYLGFLTVVSVGLALLILDVYEGDYLVALRFAAFNVVSIVTTCGYATTDYAQWGNIVVVIFLILTMIGGCTGSTSGGIKIFRFEILFMVLRVQVNRLYMPHRVVPLTYNSKPVDADAMVSVMSFGFLYIASIFVVALGLGAFGLDLVTSVSGAATAIGNVGPGLGDVIGPAGNFSTVPDGAKWVLSAAMLLGRLEFFTVLVLLNRAFWRQ